MFWGASSFNQNIGGWSVENVYEMGRCSTPLAFDQDISAWSVDNVRDMHWMFGSASSFNQNIGGWNVEQVTDALDVRTRLAFNQDIGGWSVEQVTGYALHVPLRLGLRPGPQLVRRQRREPRRRVLRHAVRADVVRRRAGPF